MHRKTNDLDYRDVCQQIQAERPEGFVVKGISVNIGLLGYDIQSNVLERICDRLEDTATYYLNDDVTIIQNDTMNDLWDYHLVHNCGVSPMYDESNDEHYCPVCENEERGIQEY